MEIEPSVKPGHTSYLVDIDLEESCHLLDHVLGMGIKMRQETTSTPTQRAFLFIQKPWKVIIEGTLDFKESLSVTVKLYTVLGTWQLMVSIISHQEYVLLTKLNFRSSWDKLEITFLKSFFFNQHVLTSASKQFKEQIWPLLLKQQEMGLYGMMIDGYFLLGATFHQLMVKNLVRLQDRNI